MDAWTWTGQPIKPFLTEWAGLGKYYMGDLFDAESRSDFGVIRTSSKITSEVGWLGDVAMRRVRV